MHTYYAYMHVCCEVRSLRARGIPTLVQQSTVLRSLFGKFMSHSFLLYTTRVDRVCVLLAHHVLLSLSGSILSSLGSSEYNVHACMYVCILLDLTLGSPHNFFSSLVILLASMPCKQIMRHRHHRGVIGAECRMPKGGMEIIIL